MKLTRERVLELHRQMWTDMQAALGDNPEISERIDFKIKWCKSHFPDETIINHCFLCDYIFGRGDDCYKCPIVWPYKQCVDNKYYYSAPISEILALPEREDEKN